MRVEENLSFHSIMATGFSLPTLGSQPQMPSFPNSVLTLPNSEALKSMEGTGEW